MLAWTRLFALPNRMDRVATALGHQLSGVQSARQDLAQPTADPGRADELRRQIAVDGANSYDESRHLASPLADQLPNPPGAPTAVRVFFTNIPIPGLGKGAPPAGITRIGDTDWIPHLPREAR